MNKPETHITRAPRVSREKILELYIKVASGNDDEKLINEVADSFYNQCSDIIRIEYTRPVREFLYPENYTDLTGGNVMSDDKIKEIEEKITDLKARWPPHSVPPSMWQQLEDLEEELEAARKEEKKESS